MELTGLQESDLVVLSQHTEAWDVLCKLNHVLHGISQSDGAVLPHLVHRLKNSTRWNTDKSACRKNNYRKLIDLNVFASSLAHTACYVTQHQKASDQTIL